MTRHARRALLVALAGVVGCVVPETELVVVVDTDLRIPDQLDHVAITASVPSGDHGDTTTALTATSTLPLTLGLVPGHGETGSVTVTATGSLGTSTVVVRTVRAAFVRGEVLTLEVPLTRRCLGVTCMDAVQSCGASGACAAIDVASLAPWSGSAPRVAPAPVPCGIAGEACCPAATACSDPGASCVGAACACSACQPVHADVTFEAGQLLGAPDGADTANGASGLAVEQNQPLSGAFSAALACLANSYLAVNFQGVPRNEVFVSFYLRFVSLPANDVRVALISSAGEAVTAVAAITVRGTSSGGASAGEVRVSPAPGSAALSGSPPVILASGVTYRIGLHQLAGAGSDGVVEAFVATADAGGGAFTAGHPFARSATAAVTHGATSVWVGNTLADGACFEGTLDDLRVDAAVMPGPSLAH